MGQFSNSLYHTHAESGYGPEFSTQLESGIYTRLHPVEEEKIECIHCGVKQVVGEPCQCSCCGAPMPV